MSLLVESNLSRDYESLVSKVEEIIKTLTDDWNDFSEGDIATILVKMFISITDMQFYQFDKGLLEQFVDTVKERHNLISILKNVGYYPKSYTSMVATGKINNAGASDFTLHKYDSFSPVSDDLERFEFTYLGEDVNVPITPEGTDPTVEVTLYQVTRQAWPSLDNNRAFTSLESSSGVSIASLHPETANNIRFSISGVNDKVVIDKISTIEYYEAGEWKDTGFREVTNFIDELNTDYSAANKDKMFRLFVDRDNRTYVEIYNASSLVAKLIRINYYTTEGADAPLSLANNEPASYNGNNTDVTLYIGSVSTGSDPESIEDARESAAKYTRSLNKAVTSDDYKTLLYEYLFTTQGMYRNYDRININPIDYYVNEVLTDSSHKIQNFDARAMYVYLPIVGSKASSDYGSDFGDEEGVQVIDLLHKGVTPADRQITKVNEYLENVKMIGVVDNVLETNNALIYATPPATDEEKVGKIYSDSGTYKYSTDVGTEVTVATTASTTPGDYYVLINPNDNTHGVGYVVDSNGDSQEFYSCRAFYKKGVASSTVVETYLPLCITRFKVYLTVAFRGYTVTAKQETARLIREKLKSYYGLSDNSFGRTLNIGELFSVIMSVDLNAIIDISSGLKYDIYYDLTGDNTTKVYRTTQPTTNTYDAWINEVLLFGGLHITIV